MGEYKKMLNKRRHSFLLETYFADADGYATKEVGRFTLVKQFNANVNEWEVAIWETVDYKRVKENYSQATLL